MIPRFLVYITEMTELSFAVIGSPQETEKWFSEFE